jgi:1-acyl-sn-glycerol-3-phosphate acyltransferase
VSQAAVSQAAVSRAGGAGAAARTTLWRGVLGLTGGLRVHGAGALPAGPCVIVANHSSHADTAALIAALPARRRPVVAAAADYWFRGGVRAAICRALCAAFPVRRSGGGSADLAAAARLLAAGHDVIVFPEGTRSRDGQTGDFHRGATRLAAAAGAPLVPAGISGTRTLLPPGGAGRPRRAAVTVRFGAPVPMPPRGGRFMIMDSFGRYPVETARDHEQGLSDATAEARARVVVLAATVTPGVLKPGRVVVEGAMVSPGSFGRSGERSRRAARLRRPAVHGQSAIMVDAVLEATIGWSRHARAVP